MRTKNIAQIFVSVLLGASLMSAQASRTWVSGVGDDANPCSRTAPCKTFAGAISKTAQGGEIDALDPGGFGALTITKSITLDGGGGQVASVLVAGTNGIVVAAQPGDVVTIRNLRINGITKTGNGGLNGIRWISGSELHIEHVAVFGFNTSGIDLEPSAGGKAFIDDTISANNGFAGLLVQAGALTSVEVYNSRFYANGNHGVWASSFSNVSVTGSDSSGNPGEGYLAFAPAGTADINISNSSANNNGTGVQAGGTGDVGAATARVAAVSLNNNGTGFGTGTNGTIKSFSNNYNSGSGTPTAGQNIPVQ